MYVFVLMSLILIYLRYMLQPLVVLVFGVELNNIPLRTPYQLVN